MAGFVRRTNTSDAQGDYARLHSVLDSLSEGVLMYSMDGVVLEANRSALDTLNVSRKEEISLTPDNLAAMFEAFTLDGRKVPVEEWPVRRVLRGEVVTNVELWVRNIRTGRKWISSHSGCPVRFGPEETNLAVLTIRDITEKKTAEWQVQESEARLKLAFDSFSDQVLIVDTALRTLYMNPAAVQAGMSHAVLNAIAFWRPVADKALRSARTVTSEVRNSTEYGWRDYFVTATPLFNAAGSVDEILVVARDCTDYKLSEEKIRKAALHDPLTGLPNRSLLYEYARHLLATASRLHHQVAVVFIDLDRFKPVNDVYGHVTGDRLLQIIGARIEQCIREGDMAARFGSDQFVLLLPQGGRPRGPDAIVSDLLNHLKMPVWIDEYEFSITASAGISVYPQDGDSPDELIKRSEATMSTVKLCGRSGYRFYAEDFAKRVLEQPHIEHELKLAIAQGKLSLAYQPLFDLVSGKIVSVEALIRWEDGAQGPEVFIPIAENTGLIARISDWVVAESGKQQQQWVTQGLPRIPIAINLSAVQLRHHDFAEDLERTFCRHGMSPESFHVELTETAVVDNLELAVKILEKLKRMGMKIALDDFGKGHSSLSYLSRLPIDKIKIDKEFIQRIEKDHASRVITDAVIALGDSLQIDVVAEGVETLEAFHYLRNRGCAQAQGFYLCSPLPGEKFASLYRQGNGMLNRY